MRLADCHPSRKHKAKGLCGACYERHLKELNPDYKERQSVNTTKWIKKNPERAKEIQLRRRAREKNDPKAWRKKKNRWLRKYGITIDQFDAMLAEQNGGCALCYRKSERLHVDHDHETGRVRGLLCHQCNWYLGTIDADPEIMIRIALYRTTEGPYERLKTS